MNIRPLQAADHGQIVELYNYYIEHTPITFDLAPYTLETRAGWFEQFDGKRYQCWVADDAGRILGYANSARFRTKAAYQTSVEVSVYLLNDAHGRGLGTTLYETLFEALKDHDVHRAYAGITQPNDASVRLHERLGFSPAGTFQEVGYKFGRYWDVAWYQKDCS